jgi:tetratricopeptide (TPR) repeat protein
MSDALLADGRPGEAAQALAQAVRLEQYDDAHLLRRSRVALAEGDRHAALAHLRRLLDLYPFGGMFLWFYALLVDSEQDRATFLADMDAALSRLHPADRPLDFEVAALHEIGDQAGALQRRALGEERFCQPLRAGPEHDNCRAWFAALAGVDLDDAVRRIDRALAASGPRADFLDTAAMVHLAVGDWDQALDAARHAARLGPDDVYMVWQAERIADLVRERSGDTDVADPNP